MRISTGYQFETYTSDIRTASEKVQKFERQVSTGKRIQVASDDPFGTSRVLSMRSIMSGVKQYQDNLKTAKGITGYTETALSEVSSLLKRAYELSVRGANSSTDQVGRNAMVNEVDSIQKRLVQIANTKGPNGQYIFAGQDNSSAPYTVTGTTLTYNGDMNSIMVEASPTDTVAANSIMEPTFSDTYTKLETLKNNLQGGNIGAISGISIGEMQSALSAVDFERGNVGAKIRVIDEWDNQYTRRVDDLTKGISDIEEVDVSEAILNYRLSQTVYEAALRVASQGFQTSLMDFIRS